MSVEKHKGKQDFLRKQHDVRFLLSDVAFLGNTKGLNMVSWSPEHIQYPEILVSGFSCASRSKLNPISVANKGCLQQGFGDTGVTFQHIAAFIERTRPLVAFLGNVSELSEKPAGVKERGDTSKDLSDEEWIGKHFQDLGFICFSIRYSCADHGSPCERDRIYLVILNSEKADVAKVSLLTRQWFMNMQLGAGRFEEFELSPKELQKWEAGCVVVQRTKRLREGGGLA